jgi:hypothetical protein
VSKLAEVRQATLAEIFSKEQAKELKKILEEAKRKGKDPLELTDVFRQTFAKWEKDLTAKEILPDYLAYAFAWTLSRYGYDKAIVELNKIIGGK